MTSPMRVYKHPENHSLCVWYGPDDIFELSRTLEPNEIDEVPAGWIELVPFEPVVPLPPPRADDAVRDPEDGPFTLRWIDDDGQAREEVSSSLVLLQLHARDHAQQKPVIEDDTGHQVWPSPRSDPAREV